MTFPAASPGRVAIGALLLAVVSIAISSKMWNRSTLLPRLILEHDLLDLGVVEPGHHSFTIKVTNGGSSTLDIPQIQSSCGCTTTESCPSLKPGESGEIRGQVSAGGGEGSAMLTLHSNDRAKLHRVALNWYGKRPPLLLPASVMASARPGEVVKREIRVVYVAGQPLEVRGISCSETAIHFTATNNDPTGIAGALPMPERRTRELAVSIEIPTPMEPGGYLYNSVVMFRQNGTDYNVKLPVRVEVVAPISTDPRRVFLGGVSREDLKGKSTQLTVSSERPVSTLKIKSRPDFIDCRLFPRDGETAMLELSVIDIPPEYTRDIEVVLEDDRDATAVISGRLIY